MQLLYSLIGINDIVTKKSDKCIMCNHIGELHESDEVGTYCLICETYESYLL
jgi:hypothetical protein